MKYLKSFFENINEYSPIGVFDSGYGGLTILTELQKVLPNNDFIFLSDNKRAPYGVKSESEILRNTLQCLEYLEYRGCKLIIVACNTASKLIDLFEQQFLARGIKIVGVIKPTCETVLKITESSKVGLLATKSTVESDYYSILLPGVDLSQMSCSHWVNLIEDTNWNTPEGVNIIKEDLDYFLKKNKEIDTLILGCTHFGILEDIINKETPVSVKIINQAKVMSDFIPGLISGCSTSGLTKYFTTESSSEFDKEYQILFGGKVNSETVVI